MIEMGSRYPFKIRALFSKFLPTFRSKILQLHWLIGPVAVISIHGRAELDAVFSMMAKTFSFAHELPILLRISDSVDMCVCFAAYSSLLRLYNAVYTVKSAFFVLVLQSSCTLCLTAEVELSRHETGPV